MKIEYFKEYSNQLKRDMEYKVFGYAGKPCIAFPTIGGRFFDYEDRGIIDSMKWYIDNGKIQVFCVDSIDKETWCADWKTPKDRIDLQEAYFNYIINEFVPRLYEINNLANGIYEGNGILLFGASLGAYHSMNCFLRHPDIFDSVLALSGVYHSGFFIKDYQDELTYMNSPIDSLKCIAKDHPYVALYKKARIIVCVGQGNWENECLEDTKALDEALKKLGVPALVDYWGFDKPHDWPSWLEQTPYFLYRILDAK